VEKRAASEAFASLPTQERLLQVAERLFAQHGIDAVSLNRIRTEAGARNSSALHYHFGSKEALIEAILAYRMQGINARRLQLLAEVVRGDREREVRGVVRALVIPFAEQLEGSPGERHYVRFVAQVYSNPDLSIAVLLHNQNASGLRQAVGLLHDILDHLPPAIIDQRIDLVQSLGIHALADRERAVNAGHAERVRLPLDVFVGTLIDASVGALLAPIVEKTESTPDRHDQDISSRRKR